VRTERAGARTDDRESELRRLLLRFDATLLAADNDLSRVAGVVGADLDAASTIA
jgi:hypothetical protein